MPRRVLVVDDGAFMRVLIRGMLEKHDCVVVGEADDGGSGVRMYKQLMPDLVTMDITMPNVDGITALKEILAFDPSASVVMVSAMGQDRYIKEAIQLGAKSFVVKPFDESSLISVIDSVMI